MRKKNQGSKNVKKNKRTRYYDVENKLIMEEIATHINKYGVINGVRL